MTDYDADCSSRESTPLLPPIRLGYDTPGSDYMTGYREESSKRTSSEKLVHDGKTRIGFSNERGTDMTSTTTYPNTSARSRTGYSSYTGGSKSSGRQHREILSSPTKSASVSKSSKINTDSTSASTGQHRVVRDHTVPFVQEKTRKNKPLLVKSYTDIPHTTIMPRNTSLPSSGTSLNLRRKRSSVLSIKEHKLASWDPPVVSNECYAEAKERLMNGGKFKDAVTKYFGEEIPWWEKISDSDDDGYDTDLDPHIGFELIADERARIILDEGEFPEYKQECRRFRSNPNSYFLRNCLNDDLDMKHRYLSKQDSITISNFIKNHLTLNSLNLEDNGIGPRGMKYFTECLRENKSLTEMYLAGNNLGPQGAKHLRSSLVSNCFLLKLDISDNNIGEKGGKYLAGIIEENVTMKELNISGNDIGDTGIKLISKALANNISLKILDVSWNNIQTNGALSLCAALKNNTELEVFLASMNGFGKEGGTAMMSVLRENNILTEVDLSSNRIPDAVVRSLTFSLQEITNLSKLNLANNQLTAKPTTDFLVSLMANPCKIKEINFEGIFVADDFKGLCKALNAAHGITIHYNDPPARRFVTSDILTKNLKILCEFMEAKEIEVEDLFPDYDEDDDDDQAMITVKEALVALEFCGKITCTDSIHKLKSKIKYGRRRKFQISEFTKVYDTVSSGHNPLEEQPLRTHLRRSIKAERAAAEKIMQSKQKRRSVFD